MKPTIAFQGGAINPSDGESAIGHLQVGAAILKGGGADHTPPAHEKHGHDGGHHHHGHHPHR